MLLSLLKSLARGRGRGDPAPAADNAVQRMERLKAAHASAPTAAHADILFRDMRIGGHGLNDLVERCVAESRVVTPPLKALHRPLASYFLARYFLHALDLGGAQAECGVMKGTSALLLCRAAQTRDEGYRGAGLHLVDSFQGLSEPTPEDRFHVSGGDGSGQSGQAMPGGWLAAPIKSARATLKEFPQVQYHKGWVPKVFAGLPQTGWSFVHLDLDLYAPTLASLEYFYPRLVSGGVIVCDDYGAPLFPGAHRAWDAYCEEHALPYVVLDTGQSALLKT